jgi:NAD(P)-dependent dehydrogenase (short-subunit alcohol dehydrogenase family)
MRGLEGKCFVVTGAASGIGWECAKPADRGRGARGGVGYR